MSFVCLFCFVFVLERAIGWVGWLVGWLVESASRDETKLRKEEIEGEGWEGIEEFCF